MKRFILCFLVTLLALPQGAYSQCTDSLTASASNYYLLKGAEAREQLHLCRQYRQLDSAHIQGLTTENQQLVKRINEDAYKLATLKRITGALLIISVILAIL
jgi:hypothetical protein